MLGSPRIKASIGGSFPDGNLSNREAKAERNFGLSVIPVCSERKMLSRIDTSCRKEPRGDDEDHNDNGGARRRLTPR